MSVTATEDKGVTVITIKANSKSMFPPLCQILGALCYSPVCCSVQKGLMNPCVTAVIGTIQIMMGLFNIALGPGRPFLNPMDVGQMAVPYWLGAVYTAVGLMSFMAGQFPSPCLVGLGLSMNVVGAVFAIVGIVLYGIEVYDLLGWRWYDYWRDRYVGLLTTADTVSVIMAVLQLCLCIGFAVLTIKALVNRKKEEQVVQNVEDQQPELKEILLTSPCA
ncbi:membrane-spanning 4-domains subfamily A member 15-like isoform X1 [Trachinotus anak]|uniref:membrane-spanning 4-domains subfamily A member 15-like isoform X1 n=1 Tax=Trachinotus anak TaxID=443729 RepID=UPI0039F1D2A5